MTFSFGIKKELCSNFPKTYEKALSEVIGIIKVMGIFDLSDVNKVSFKISSENKNIIDYVQNMFLEYFSNKFIFNIERIECFSKINNYILKINSKFMVDFFKEIDIFNLNSDSISVNDKFDYDFIEYKSFIKGVFIGCGSMSNPEKGYHLEFVIQNLNFSIYFRDFLNYHGFNSKIIKRKIYYVVYIKEADNISKILGTIGACNAVLDFENIRVKKEYSNNKNRLRNCIEANEDKLIITSVRQVRAIMFIDDKIGLDKLPKNLKEIAEIRLKYKEMSLKDLGMFLKPPLGKSGVLHRLRKIEKIAEDLKSKM
ncbi:DNA-binding protein WhiA [Candidatus Arthromitus sp. SFB-turkey]|uniref:DNA-binding protein WhiA n=1 Tax=Candidatus Arthromitus sp. SFB-turkey TaxID=1840217 RepID=UPI0007F552AE|nr:DNA-binding protein WhiA [Candidatus Arthromitus sp. SFB-turkey]OAT89263.1 hypothetical protein A6P36_00625 [Candidatus Arthromitus sp. SFB-turkey]HJC99538.1 DNA-binding protein WhiA [Candidatus Dwaynia gallinarum]